MSKSQDWVDLGQIGKPQGLKGEVRISLFDINLEDIQRLPVEIVHLKFPRQKNIKELNIENQRIHKEFWVVKFSGIDDRDAAEGLRSCIVCVSENDLWEPDDGEFFEFELIGCTVIDCNTKQEVGKVSRIENQVGNDLLVLKTEKNSEVMLPFVKEFLKEINLEQQKISYDFPDGLLELNEV